MPTQALEKWNEKALREKKLLSAGEEPPRRLKDARQRTAARALAGFFALMLLLTLLSRAADGLTVAQVETAQAKTGILTQRVTVNGTIEAQGDLPLTLPGGIQVLRVAVKKGDRVQVGDVLLELDQEGLEASLKKLRNDLKVLDLRIEAAGQGNTSGSTDALLSARENEENARSSLALAEQALKNAEEDHERLLQSRETAQARSAEDTAQARADVEKAEAELKKAEVKAKEELEKAAKEKADAARESLKELEESASEEKGAAQEVLDSARQGQSSAGDAYWNAIEARERADRLVKEAQEALDRLLEEETPNEEAVAAAQAALSQAQSVQLQIESSLGSLGAANDNANQELKRARESLNKVNEKWEKSLGKARETLEKAEAELSQVQAKTDMSEEPLVVSAQSALDSARRALQSAERMEEDAKSSTEDQLRSSLRAVESARQNVESAERSLESAGRGVESARRQQENERKNDESARRQAEIERLGYLSQKEELLETIAALEEAAAAGGVVTAPIGGTVLSILEEPGKTQEGARVALLSRSDLGFQFEGKLGEKEAGKLSVGDEGTLSYQQEGKRREVKAVVSGIGMADGEGQARITVRLEGSYPIGASASLELTKRSRQYDTCLPVSALRGEGGDYFVLVVEETDTVLGKEQTAVKVPVELLERDSKLAAVEAGMLQRGDKVIVSSSKPIDKGDRVREAG